MADVTKDRARQHRLADALRERRRAERTERDAKEEARERRWRNSGKAFVKVAPFFTTTAGQVEIVGPKGTATVRSGVVELINYADHQYDYRITVVVELVDGEPTITPSEVAIIRRDIETPITTVGVHRDELGHAVRAAVAALVSSGGRRLRISPRQAEQLLDRPARRGRDSVNEDDIRFVAKCDKEAKAKGVPTEAYTIRELEKRWRRNPRSGVGWSQDNGVTRSLVAKYRMLARARGYMD